MTRILAGSDFHTGPLVDQFEARLDEDRLPIFCGDLVDRPRHDSATYHEILRRWRHRAPELVVVPGNHDPDDAPEWEGVRVHERRGLSILAIPVIPILYKIPSWTHEYSEARIAEMVEPFAGAAYDLVVSHGPPRGVCDRAAWGRHIGSRALRDLAERIDFRLWLCGHVHEQSGARGTLRGRPVRNVARAVVEMEVPAGGIEARRPAAR